TEGTVAPTRMRRVHFDDAWHDTAIYDRLALPVGTEITGPAILEQPDTTVLIDPGLKGRVDRFGNTIIETGEA
ncbi:MAG: hydantoinase/oxoprolinase family protein, partial [Pseudomonadota bacterium]